MNILSLYLNLPSSASIFVDGKVVAATHEERFTRLKNDEVFPENAIRYCLEQAGIAPSDVDAVAIASFIAPFDDLAVRLLTEAGGSDKASERPVFVRADGRAPYQAVARVMARLSASGFTKLNLITDTAPEA